MKREEFEKAMEICTKLSLASRNADQIDRLKQVLNAIHKDGFEKTIKVDFRGFSFDVDLELTMRIVRMVEENNAEAKRALQSEFDAL
jgi:hypothetical protein